MCSPRSADPGGLTYAPEPLGLALRPRGRRTRVQPDRRRRSIADRVVLTTSTSEAYALLFKLLCDPGDAVLVPQPSYPLFESLAGLEAVRAEPVPARVSRPLVDRSRQPGWRV